MKHLTSLVKTVFSNPTAPYREGWVLQCIKRELQKINVPYFEDRWGNIIAGVSSSKAIRNHQVALVAHTDHPGFHLIKETKPRWWLARWLGGAPPQIYKSLVHIHHPEHPQTVCKGLIQSKTLTKSKQGRTFLIQIKASEFPLDPQCFGSFAFPGFSLRGHRVHTRAADDLAGVVIILATLKALTSKERKNMLGLFSRAEEVGFRGVLGVLENKTFSRQNRIISLEASRQLPGARLGRGPVIRLGDRRSLFDTSVIAQLDRAAQDLKDRNKKWLFQRRIMDGGTCEATAFNLHQIRAAGLAVPLGNYHNERPQGTPGAEYIDLRDLETAVELCTRFYKNLSRNIDPLEDLKQLLNKEFQKDKPLLKETIHYKEWTP